MKKRLSKALAGAGVASRRKCEELIFAGRVAVNGMGVLEPQMLVDATDSLSVDGQVLPKEETKVYYLLNKPVGYLCTNVRLKGGARIVLDLFTHIPYRLFSVGRLDQDTSGIILITNDGHFANRVIHPSYQVSKEYLVKTSMEITDEHLKILSRGTSIQGVHVKPLAVHKVRKGTLKITVGEGKKHEVRTLIAKAGLNLLELTRIRIGSLLLGTLPPGGYRELTHSEIKSFM